VKNSISSSRFNRGQAARNLFTVSCGVSAIAQTSRHKRVWNVRFEAPI
jgi:hypothetical protein